MYYCPEDDSFLSFDYYCPIFLYQITPIVNFLTSPVPDLTPILRWFAFHHRYIIDAFKVEPFCIWSEHNVWQLWTNSSKRIILINHLKRDCWFQYVQQHSVHLFSKYCFKVYQNVTDIVHTPDVNELMFLPALIASIILSMFKRLSSCYETFFQKQYTFLWYFQKLVYQYFKQNGTTAMCRIHIVEDNRVCYKDLEICYNKEVKTY